jgi:hypothetical protein
LFLLFFLTGSAQDWVGTLNTVGAPPPGNS